MESKLPNSVGIRIGFGSKGIIQHYHIYTALQCAINKEFETVKKWLREVRKHGTGSTVTQKSYLRTLTKFCEWTKQNPDELISKAEASEKPTEYAQDLVGEYFDYLSKLGQARKSCSTVYGTLRGFYRYNGIQFIEKTPPQWVEKETRTPDKTQLQEVLEACYTPREQFIILALRSKRESSFIFYSQKRGSHDPKGKLVGNKTSIKRITRFPPFTLT